MKFNLFKISLTFIILFVVASIIPSINGFVIIKNKEFNLNVLDPVYNSTPDWVSGNPDFSTGGALADFNQDGWLDLVVSDGNDMGMGHVKVYYNDGEGHLPTIASWQSSDIAYNGHLDVADVNGDGWPDVAVSYLGNDNSNGSIARVYINNNGELSLSPYWNADIIGNAFGVDFGDMNNDGRPDLAVATGWSYSQYSYHTYVYLNVDGELESTASWVSDDEYIYQGVLWIDADDDGWLDLAGIGTGQDTQIYHNLGGMLETIASWHTTDSSNQDGIMLAAGDVTSDGLRDLFTTDNTQLGGSGLFKQYTGLDTGFFKSEYSWNYYCSAGSAVALADVNNDGKLDLATGGWWDFTRLFINDGTGLPTSPSWSSTGATLSTSGNVVEKIVFGNVGPDFCENTYIKNFPADGDRQLFYLPHQQIQAISSVSLDGDVLLLSDYTYSREDGWISVNTAPSEYLEVVYNYSSSIDMVVTNWDPNTGNYLFYNQLNCSEFEPDLASEGSLVWNDVKSGKTVEGSFTVSNIGDANSLLDWKIDSFPDWGTWSFSLQNEENLRPEDGPVIVNVEVVTPSDINSEFSGKLKIININNPDDFSEMDVVLKTSRTSSLIINHFIFNKLFFNFLTFYS